MVNEKEAVLGESGITMEPSERGVAPDPVRIPILATGRWSLLAQRSRIWSQLFNDAAKLVTVL